MFLAHHLVQVGELVWIGQCGPPLVIILRIWDVCHTFRQCHAVIASSTRFATATNDVAGTGARAPFIKTSGLSQNFPNLKPNVSSGTSSHLRKFKSHIPPAIHASLVVQHTPKFLSYSRQTSAHWQVPATPQTSSDKMVNVFTIFMMENKGDCWLGNKIVIVRCMNEHQCTALVYEGARGLYLKCFTKFVSSIIYVISPAFSLVFQAKS